MKNFFLLYSHLYARISSKFVNKKVNSRQSYKHKLYICFKRHIFINLNIIQITGKIKILHKLENL